MSAVPLAIQVGGSAISVCALYGTYTESQRLLPPGPYAQVAAGAVGGTVLAMTSIPMNIPIFPETSSEHAVKLPGTHLRNIAKTASGYACFFAVSEGLRTGIYKARLTEAERKGVSLPPREDDAQWHMTNFLAGGVAGIAYRAATLPFFKGIENPLLTSSGFGILAGTFIAMGTMMAGFGWVDTAFNIEPHSERWMRK